MTEFDLLAAATRGAPRFLPVFTALFSGTLDTLEAAPVVVVHSGSVGALKLRLYLKHRPGASDAKQPPGFVAVTVVAQ